MTDRGAPADIAQRLSDTLRHAKEAEQAAAEELDVYKSILREQERLLAAQKAALLAVSTTAGEIVALDKKRAELVARLEEQRSALLVASCEANAHAGVVKEALSGPVMPVSAGAGGRFLLNALEKVFAEVSELIGQAMKAPELQVDASALGKIILQLNDAMDEGARLGLLTESNEDEIERVQFAIDALVPGGGGSGGGEEDGPE